jgi:23S rRNA (uridine2552-2'-O)-methyltransferase
MPRRTGSSQRWRQRQERDIYVEQANRGGWRSRAVFKLEQIQAKEHLLRRGTVCVDLGSSPGGWSQLAAKLVGPTGRVVAIDLLAMVPIPGVEFLEGDFTTPETLQALRNLVGAKPVDLVMSDMAPNISGNRAMDQPRSMALLDEALLFAREVLRPGGDFLVKAFQGEGIDAFTRELKEHFKVVKILKPKASRPESREIYLLARSYGM